MPSGLNQHALCGGLLLLLLCPAQAQTASGGTQIVVEGDREVAPELVEAEALIEQEKFSEAEPLLLAATKSDPSHYRGWFDLGYVYHQLGKLDDAIAAYRRSVSLQPGIFESNLNLGLLLAQADNPEAEKYLVAATKLKPASDDGSMARAWLALAHLREKSDIPGALAAYEKAAQLDPADPEPRISAGYLRFQTADYSAAEKDFREAIRIAPDNVGAQIGLADLYLKSGQAERAEALLLELAQSPLTRVEASVKLARLYEGQKKIDEALAHIEAVADEVEDPSPLHIAAAEMCMAQKRYPQAIEHYKEALDDHEYEAEIHADLGVAYLRARQFALAQQEFETALSLDPQVEGVHGELALAASENKNYPLALKSLDAHVRQKGETAAAHFLRATIYDHMKDRQKAADSYRRFLAVSNGSSPDEEWKARRRLKALE